jgi:protein translocase SecG subunit
METALLITFLLVSITIIALIMLEKKIGGGLSGGSFNSSNTSEGLIRSSSSSFSTRAIAFLTAIFFLLSLTLGNLKAMNPDNVQKSKVEISR